MLWSQSERPSLSWQSQRRLQPLSKLGLSPGPLQLLSPPEAPIPEVAGQQCRQQGSSEDGWSLWLLRSESVTVSSPPLSLSVVLATFNEKDNLAPMLEQLKGLLGQRYQLELVVVDDDSPDGTSSWPASWQARPAHSFDSPRWPQRPLQRHPRRPCWPPAARWPW